MVPRAELVSILSRQVAGNRWWLSSKGPNNFPSKEFNVSTCFTPIQSLYAVVRVFDRDDQQERSWWSFYWSGLLPKDVVRDNDIYSPDVVQVIRSVWVIEAGTYYVRSGYVTAIE